MKGIASYLFRKLKWLVAFSLVMACVERIEFDVPDANLQTVIEGMISDMPGPYTVKISKGMSINADTSLHIPVEQAKVTLLDDQGNVEDFIETNPGLYVTGGAIQGEVGHAYHIEVKTQDGKIFQSEPEVINPAGQLENIHFEYEARKVLMDFGEVAADVFNIYVDAKAGEGTENFVRWKFKGTYRVETIPKLHETWVPPYTPYRDPLPCSGYVVTGGPVGSGGLLEQRSECVCCTCWASHLEIEPQLSDTQLVSDNQFKNVKVGEVPINSTVFFDKYLVEVEQMNLSRNAFEFFKLIREQKQGASSLFQPPSAEIKGNFISTNSSESVVGLFWAASVRRKHIFIQRSDVPYPLTPFLYLTVDCRTYFPNSTNAKPDNWE